MRDHRAIEFQAVSSADGIRAVLPDCFRLHCARAEAPGMVVHPDVFHAKASSDFLVDVWPLRSAGEDARLPVARRRGR